MDGYILAIDQGTTNSRAMLFNQNGQVIAQHSVLLRQYYPHSGWVEQDPEAMVINVIECCRATLHKAQIKAQHVAAVGITNQRETTIMWDKSTGLPIYPAIVWQDRRTSLMCDALNAEPFAPDIQQKTGLLIDPYFSATKILWILKNVPKAQQLLEQGLLLFGTVETYLLWRLSKGESHFTDITNASRTMLFNIHTLSWDSEILNQLGIPASILPEVKDNAAQFGNIHHSWLGHTIPITGMAGDQQAALIGQACFEKGMSKVTYGTGCFMLLNTGDKVVHSKNKLLSTIAYRIKDKIAYGVEGSIFSAGNTVKWLRDQLHFYEKAAATEALAANVASNEGVYLVPAFTGLGAPYWEPNARGAILGLTLNTQIEHIVRAGLESVGYQTRDLINAIKEDCNIDLQLLRVDGGMTANNWFLQFLADIVDCSVQRPVNIETTALGAAYLAGLELGMYASLSDIKEQWQMDACFTPQMQEATRTHLYSGWQHAVAQVLS